MNTLPILLATALYVWQAINFAMVHKYGMAFTFVGYSVANLGIIWATQN